MNTENLFISADDARALAAILGDIPADQASALLAEAFNGADVVVPPSLPPNVVGIYTCVEYIEIESGVRRGITLVPPAEADIAAGRISLLSPVGRALLGRSVGAVSEVYLPEGRTLMLKIEAVTPRAADTAASAAQS
jgi:regulator of nucleoside diphosphate kinase